MVCILLMKKIDKREVEEDLEEKDEGNQEYEKSKLDIYEIEIH